jgi:hypothetical protein
VANLDPYLVRILGAIVAAYKLEADGQREPLMHLRTAGGELVKNHGWSYDGPAVNRNDLQDLEDLKLIRIERNNGSWLVAPSHQGVSLAELYERDAAVPANTVRLDWDGVRPVLEAILACWERSGAGRFDSVALPAIVDELGPHADPVFVQRAVDMLEQDEWVECEHEMGTPYPLAARPRRKALGLSRGWPAADSVVASERLTAVLEQLIAAEPNEEKRGKLALVRDVLIELGARTAGEITARLLGA